MTSADEVATQRWYAVEDDMSATGAWCVMNVDKSPVHSNPDTGEIQIARYLSESAAREFARLHNAGLAGRPALRPERYRVNQADAMLFDEIGQTLTDAHELLGAADSVQSHQRSAELMYLRNALGATLRVLDLLTEGAIRLRSQAEAGR